MDKISEDEFRRLCSEICNDSEVILKHNQIGTREETLLWMLLGCLISYLSLEETEIPCFAGRSDAETYREAIHFVISGRCSSEFDPDVHLDNLFI